MTNEQELVDILDEMAGAAVSMSQGAQSYDCFIKARERCLNKIRKSFASQRQLTSAIKELHNLTLAE